MSPPCAPAAGAHSTVAHRGAQASRCGRGPDTAHWTVEPKRRVVMSARPLAVLVLVGLAGSCGGASSPTAPGATSSTQCSTSGQVTFVRDTLQNIYYWYKEL